MYFSIPLSLFILVFSYPHYKNLYSVFTAVMISGMRRKLFLMSDLYCEKI